MTTSKFDLIVIGAGPGGICWCDPGGPAGHDRGVHR